MKITKLKYPFDPSIKHHIIIGFGLSVWIFLFLYFTEPLDVNELDAIQKLIYLPIYGLICGACYSVFIPFQVFLFKKVKTVALVYLKRENYPEKIKQKKDTNNSLFVCKSVHVTHWDNLPFQRATKNTEFCQLDHFRILPIKHMGVQPRYNSCKPKSMQSIQIKSL